MGVIVLCGRSGSGKDTVAEMLAADGYFRLAIADEIKRLALHCFDGQITPEWCFGPSALRDKEFLLSPPTLLEAIKNFCSYPKLRSYFGLRYDGQVLVRRFVEVLEPRLHERVTVRWLLQHLGSEWGRSFMEDVWLEQLQRTVDLLEHGSYGYSPQKGLVPSPGRAGTRNVVITDARLAEEVKTLRRICAAQAFWVDASERLPPLAENAHSTEPRDDVRELFKDHQVIDNNGTLDDLRATIQKLNLR